MRTCTVVVEPSFTIAPVPPRLFGSFVEHMGRCVYGGLFEPGHPEADVDGIRSDVVKLTRELGVTVVRYPGGNFVSGYRWEDGVGPLADRPARLDLAWGGVEPNTFGLDEFIRWAGEAEVEPMMAVNLGTRGVQEACDLLEYANIPGGTRLSDLRVAHGARDPYGIRLWCLGNEMDGPWQLGHTTATAYGLLAAQTARAMRRVDPRVELVACGSSNERMPTFGSWESDVLEHCHDDVDHLSLHAYYGYPAGNRLDFLAAGQTMDDFIDGVTATCDAVAARKRSRKRIGLSFDEWNVWDEQRPSATADPDVPSRLIEEAYTTLDAVVVGGLLISLLRHSDRVRIACLAQLVNVIAPIRTEPDTRAWRQTIYHPFALTARHARGNVLRVEPSGPVLHSPTLGDVPAVDLTVTRDPATGELAIFALNRDDTGGVQLELRLTDGPTTRVVEHLVLGGGDLAATNTRDVPDRVVPRTGTGAAVNGRTLSVPLPPASWTLLRTEPITAPPPSADRLTRAVGQPDRA